MTDDEPPATRADLDRLAAETAERAYALHAELLAALAARASEVERAVEVSIRDAAEHGLRVQRAELRLLRHAVTTHAEDEGRIDARPPPGAEPRWRLSPAAVAGAVVVLVVAAIAVRTLG
ncbi:MAG: hypothetical protein AAF962_22605 [Actinomycetota bacterium]